MNAKQRQPIPLFADLHAGLERLEAQHGPMPEIAELRRMVSAADPERAVRPSLSAADAVVGAAQLRTIVHLFADRMPDDSKALLLRIAEALEGAR